jgi:hypothetical protein
VEKANPDTAPEILRCLERRSPIRRVYRDFLVRAGSETGAPVAMSGAPGWKCFAGWRLRFKVGTSNINIQHLISDARHPAYHIRRPAYDIHQMCGETLRSIDNTGDYILRGVSYIQAT